jgi:glycosyltransferase involved in cell wall biosynthesis
MLAFITTLRHPRNSADYGRVEALLQDTLRSISRQSCDDYLIIIVGNQLPAFDLPSRAVFVEVDFPPPSTHNGPRTGPASVIWDKGTKNAIGLIAARDHDPEYVMFFDADDFVHRDIAEFVAARPGAPGWVSTRGWIYSRRRNAYALRRKFYRHCGTSFIIPWAAYEVPPQLTVTAGQQEIAQAFGERLERSLEHGFAYDWWHGRGRVLQPLPFPGAVYHVDTGENHSGNILFGPALPYRPHLYRDYGLRPSKSPASTLWSAVGPASFARWPAVRLRQPKSFLENFSPPADSVSR